MPCMLEEKEEWTSFFNKSMKPDVFSNITSTPSIGRVDDIFFPTEHFLTKL